jgi:polar amino acid transport system substrate-binding protein
MMNTRKIKKFRFLRALCTLCACIFLGCATTGNEETVVQPRIPPESSLRVGITPTTPPLIFYQGGRIAGLEQELANALAESLGKTAKFVIVGWNELIPALLENRIDIIMSGMSITKMRETRINFSSPYLKAGQMSLIRSGDASFVKSASSIKNTQARVGFLKGTTGEFLVQKEFLMTTRKIPFAAARRAVQFLVEERIDIFIAGAPVIWWMAAKKEAKGLIPVPTLLTEEYFAWGIRKDNTELLESTNDFLETWKNDGRLKEVIMRWMPFAPPESMPWLQGEPRSR